jgi:hypothetical protein
MAIMTRVSGCGNAYLGEGTRGGAKQATPEPAPGNLVANEDSEASGASLALMGH